MGSLKLTSPIPKDTREALRQHNWRIDNIALLLNKYLDFLLIEECNNEKDDCFITLKRKVKIKNNLKIKEKNFINKQYKIKKILKNTAIRDINFFPVLGKKGVRNEDKILEKILDKNEEIGKLEYDFLINLKKGLKDLRKKFIESDGTINKTLNSILKKLHDRQEKIVGKRNTIKLTIRTRLIVSLGSGSVLETSVKLHHIYGIPYIPAFAIKEILRAYKILKLAEEKGINYEIIKERIEKNKPLYDEEKKIIEIFGNQQQKGKLIILDAYPVKFEGFDIDVMKPRFSDFYDDKDNKVSPTDWQNPKPITFLAIPKNTEFIFYFKNSYIYNGNLENDLKNAFETIGIGGKTTLGYEFLE